MAGPGPIVADLRAESDDLDALVAPLPAHRWADPTPAPGWTIAHQIGHLLWTDRVALTAVTDEAGFAEAAGTPPRPIRPASSTRAPRNWRPLPPAELLADWRATRGRLHEALLTVPDGRKLPWFGPPMSAASMATARLMETWAHGLDVADALGVKRPATERLRSIAHLGVRTRDYAFFVNNLAAADRAVPGRAARTRRRHLVLGTARRRAARHRLRRGLLLPGHPAAPAAAPWTSRRTAPTRSAGWRSRKPSPGRPAPVDERAQRAKRAGARPTRALVDERAQRAKRAGARPTRALVDERANRLNAVAAVPCPVLGLGLFAQRCNREVQPVGQLAVCIAGHHARMQSQPEQPAVGICDGVNVAEVHAVGDGFGLRDKGFPLIGRLAQFPQNRFDEVSCRCRFARLPDPDTMHSIVDRSDQRQFIIAAHAVTPGDAAAAVPRNQAKW